MFEVLFVKTSSLGDIIHHMPAITDVRRHFPNARLSWIVEEAYAPLVKLHPGIDEVIPVASRRWRRQAFSVRTWHEIRAFIRQIREHHYDKIIDTQGLLRTAFISKIGCGQRHGYNSSSIREPVASQFYDIRHKVRRDLHAIERNRILTGLALDYTPEGEIDFGLKSAVLPASSPPYCVLLHSTARPEKEWRYDNWVFLGHRLAERGFDLLLPWGTEAERLRAESLAAKIPRARVTDRQPLDDVAKMISAAKFVVGVDTGLLHLAAALGVPLVGIFIESEPDLTGPIGAGPHASVGGRGEMPSTEDVIEALDRIEKN